MRTTETTYAIKQEGRGTHHCYHHYFLLGGHNASHGEHILGVGGRGTETTVLL